MHGVTPSRGKVLFEVFCALAISASLTGAWMQTGASALVGAAAVAALYGLVHLFDMRRPKPVEAVEPQRIDFDTDEPNLLPAYQAAVVPMAAPEEQLMPDHFVEEAEIVESVEPVEPAAPKARAKTKAPRKAGSRRSTKEPKVAELALTEEVEASQPAAPEDDEVAAPWPLEEDAHSHIAPLFEPEPFARMQRRAFGRRGQI